MIDGVQVYDEFLPDAHKIRKHALLSEFGDFHGQDGQVYKRVALLNVPGVKDRIEELMGPIKMLGQGYRLNYNNEPPNQAIHSDLGWGTHALVYFLSEGRGGTAFWRHKRTGATAIYQGEVELFHKIGSDWEDENAWKIREVVEMKFGRALIYPSALFHSRYPFKAFGTTPETGRLISVAFFTPEYMEDDQES